MVVDGDPLMPAVQRFPVNISVVPASDERPSTARPFILRGVTPRPFRGSADVVSARHRTSPGPTLVPRTCNLDGRIVDDSYTVPDD
jgi:hypothetical protein